MKKLFCLFASLFLLSPVIFCSYSCQKTSFLLPYVSELRSNIYEGHGDTYNLKAYYGYRESPYTNDGKVGEYSYEITFILKGIKDDNVAFSLEFYPTGEIVTFEKSKGGYLVAVVKSYDLKESEFPVNLKHSSEIEAITMTSILPENTLDINGVLTAIEKSQEALINSYTVDFNFTAEIFARVIVKDGKPFWYLAFANGKTLKAFLADGTTGEVLAIREVL